MAPFSIRQASNFLQQKYKVARLIFADVSEAELRTKEVTDDTPRIPDAKAMTQIAEASYELDEYWRIVDVLHSRLIEDYKKMTIASKCRLSSIDWQKWRSYYNSLTLLEFLITHGPEDIPLEFRCDIDAIKELATFHYVDDRGFNWGTYMKNKSERILQLMQRGPLLHEVRMKAIKLTNGIQGFGNSPASPLSSSSSPTSAWKSSFNSYWPSNLHTWDEDIEEKQIPNKKDESKTSPADQRDPIQHNLLDNIFDEEVTKSSYSLNWLLKNHNEREPSYETRGLEDAFEKKVGLFQGFICSKHSGYASLQSEGSNWKILSRPISDVGRQMKKMLAPQYSLGH